MKAFDNVPVPAVVVTVTLTVPAERDGAVAVIFVGLSTRTNVADVPPKATEGVPEKFVPLIVTDVPPAVGPDVGLIEVIVGTELPLEPLDVSVQFGSTSGSQAAEYAIVGRHKAKKSASILNIFNNNYFADL